MLAATFQQPDTLSFYNLVVFIHILAAIVAFGVVFMYPLIDVVVHRPANRHHLPAWYRLQALIDQRVVTLAATVVLLAGIYLAAAGPFKFSSLFVSTGIVIIVVILGLTGAFLVPTERRLADLAERDIAASAGGDVRLSAEYEAAAGRLRTIGALASGLVLVAVFVMVMKPA